MSGLRALRGESLRVATVDRIRLERTRPDRVFLKPLNGIDGLLADGVIDTAAKTYALRPPLSLERLSRAADGRVVLSLRRPLYDGTTAVAFTPTKLLRRLGVVR